MLDWDGFRLILAIGRDGSLGRAGQKLGVSHTTVARQLKKTEQQLGTKLFDRLTSGMHPTEAGMRAIAYGERMEILVDEANRDLFSQDDDMSGEIRLSMPHNVFSYGISEDLAAFTEQFPEISFSVTTTDAVTNFLNRDVDVVFRSSNNPTSGLWGHKLYTAAFSFFASKTFLESWRAQMDHAPSQVPLPYVAMNNADPWRDRDLLLEKFPAAKLIAGADVFESIYSMIVDGTGVGRLPNYMAYGQDELVNIIICPPEFGRSFWILTIPDFRNTPRIRVFMDFMKGRFQARQEMFS